MSVCGQTSLGLARWPGRPLAPVPGSAARPGAAGARGSAGGEEGSIESEVLEEGTTLPLPVLMLRGNVAITKRVFLKGSFDVFYISLSGFEGLLMDTTIALEGHICRFFGMGLGYDIMKIEIEGDGGDDFLGGGWNGKLNLDYSGLYVYMKFFF